MRFYKLLSEYFGISQSLCNCLLPIKGSKDEDLKNSQKWQKIIIVLFSNK